MGDMGYGYGSQWHMLRYLGRHQHELNRCIENEQELKDLAARVICWLDFPYAGNWTLDGEWRKVGFLPQGHPARLKWPSDLNPSWDAVGRIQISYPNQGSGEEWLLVEAKAHTGELCCDPNAAGGQARAVIQKHLHETRDRISRSTNSTNDSDWMGRYYQLANRLYTIDFLNQNGVPSRLLLIYFCKDQCTGSGSRCPVDANDWRPALDAMYADLGLTGGLGDLGDRVHNIYLPVSPGRGTPLLQNHGWYSPRRP